MNDENERGSCCVSLKFLHVVRTIMMMMMMHLKFSMWRCNNRSTHNKIAHRFYIAIHYQSLIPGQLNDTPQNRFEHVNKHVAEVMI